MTKQDYSLYLIADDSLCRPDEMMDVVLKAVDNGVSCVQLRMKQTPAEHMISIGKKLSHALRLKQVPLIINDHVEIANVIDAEGVHLGQTDMPYAKARDYLGHHKIIGLSIENDEQAKICQHADVNYFGIGPIFHTNTKPDAAPAIGVVTLKKMCTLFSKPVVAIGGINEDNLSAVMQTGVSGVAIASAILSAKHPGLAAKRLAHLILRRSI